MTPVPLLCVSLCDPEAAELERIGREFGLHELAVEDALHAQQRPKVERYDDTMLVVAKAVVYDDEREELDFGDVLVACGPRFVVVIAHAPSPPLDLDTPRAQELATADDPGVILHRVLDQVVDGYGPVMDELELDIRQIEETVFGPSDDQPTERIYLLKREVIALLRAIRPLRQPLDALIEARPANVDRALAEYFRDVRDHLERAVQRAETASEMLTEALDANLTQVSLRQNEDMRKMSAWAAIFLVPTLMAGIWGMNFAHMPELDWRLGYPLALATMVLSALALRLRFRAIGWL